MSKHKPVTRKHHVRNVLLLVVAIILIKLVAHDMHEVVMTATLAVATSVLDSLAEVLL